MLKKCLTMQSQMKGHTHGKNGVCICDLGGIFATALSLYLCEYSSMEVLYDLLIQNP